MFQTLTADVVPLSEETQLQSIKETILQTSDPWDQSNHAVVRFDPAPPKLHPDEDELFSRYPPPQPSKFLMSAQLLEPALTMENYKERLHQLLYIEEMGQYKALECFNVNARLVLCKSYGISASDTTKWTREGELFGKIDLGEELSEDTEPGKLILTMCSSVYLKLNKIVQKDGKREKEVKRKNLKKKVWECFVEDYSKRSLYLRIPWNMVDQNKLTDQMRINIELQFKLSRMSIVGEYKSTEIEGIINIVIARNALCP